MIRPASPTDAPAIAEIWNHIIRDTVMTFTTAEKTASSLATAMETQPFFISEAEGVVTGFATYTQFRPGPGYVFTVEHSIHIADHARGQGLGRALMELLEDHARGEGMHSMIAGISGENPFGVSFHTVLGYAEVARLPQVGQKFGRWHDLVLMQKFL